jgi:hypothetical protein
MQAGGSRKSRLFYARRFMTYGCPVRSNSSTRTAAAQGCGYESRHQRAPEEGFRLAREDWGAAFASIGNFKNEANCEGSIGTAGPSALHSKRI